jgi:hypothetical protein
MKVADFWDIAPCSLFKVDRRFRTAYQLHDQGNDDTTRHYIPEVCNFQVYYQIMKWSSEMFVIKFQIACNPLLFYRAMKVRIYETIILRGDLYGCYMSSLTWMSINLKATCLVRPKRFVIWRVILVNSSAWTWQGARPLTVTHLA